MNKIFFCLLLSGSSLLVHQDVLATEKCATAEKTNVDQASLAPFLLENTHPAWNALQEIFTQSNPLESAAALDRAGFKMVSPRSTGMCVVSHPRLPKYLLKLYPLNVKNNAQLDLSWAIERCTNARNLRDLIAEKSLKHFSVPMKWIYILPNYEKLNERGIKNYAILLVEDMELVTQKESRFVWSHLNSTEVIDELYTILTFGYSSCHLPANMPYTKNGTFSCIDTEAPHTNPGYERVNKYLSTEMQHYWNRLVNR